MLRRRRSKRSESAVWFSLKRSRGDSRCDEVSHHVAGSRDMENSASWMTYQPQNILKFEEEVLGRLFGRQFDEVEMTSMVAVTPRLRNDLCILRCCC